MSSADDKPGADGDEGITDQPSAVGPQFTPEQLEQLRLHQFAALVMEVCEVLRHLAPHLPANEARRIAESVAREQFDQQQIPTILQSILSQDAVAKHPTLHLYVSDAKNRIEMRAPKRLETIKDLGAAAQSTVLLAFILSPAARAVLKAFGFKYNLAQSQTPAGGRVILSS